MIRLVIIALFLTSFTPKPPTNPFVGTWKSYLIKSFEDQYKIKEGEFDDFSSTITFNEDLTYIKRTTWKETKGRYTFTANELCFYEALFGGGEYRAYKLRWPKNTNDPMPQTPEIDISFPELFKVETENGPGFADLDVYYKKEEEK